MPTLGFPQVSQFQSLVHCVPLGANPAQISPSRYFSCLTHLGSILPKMFHCDGDFLSVGGIGLNCEGIWLTETLGAGDGLGGVMACIA